MTAVYNVNRSVDDPFYRYKMPAIVAKVEGKGNGIKTVIPNMAEIAQALDRPASYPTKFFGIELGAQTKMDEANDRYIVNGAHSANDLQSHLDGFIQKFVLCPHCDNPETSLHVSKKSILQDCAACGFSGPLKYVTHRLYNYILNHPPKKSAKKGQKKADSDKKRPSESDKKEEEEDENEEAAFDGDIEAPALDPDRDDEDEEWSADTSAEAIRRREEAQLGGAVSKFIASSDADLDIDERVNLFHDFVKQRLESNSLVPKEILDKATLLDVLEPSAIVLVELLLTGDSIVAGLKKYQALFQLFTNNRSKVQRRLLNGIEIRVDKSNIPLTKMPDILNALYQLDIVEEDAFMGWHGKVSKRYVSKDKSKKIREASAAFIDWLKDAESEEDEEDEEEEEEADAISDASKEDEDDVEIQFSTTAATASKPVTRGATQQKPADTAAANDDDDDIDIDAI